MTGAPEELGCWGGDSRKNRGSPWRRRSKRSHERGHRISRMGSGQGRSPGERLQGPCRVETESRARRDFL